VRGWLVGVIVVRAGVGAAFLRGGVRRSLTRGDARAIWLPRPGGARLGAIGACRRGLWGLGTLPAGASPAGGAGVPGGIEADQCLNRGGWGNFRSPGSDLPLDSAPGCSLPPCSRSSHRPREPALAPRSLGTWSRRHPSGPSVRPGPARLDRPRFDPRRPGAIGEMRSPVRHGPVRGALSLAHGASTVASPGERAPELDDDPPPAPPADLAASPDRHPIDRWPAARNRSGLNAPV
jgi:hypothetical protein